MFLVFALAALLGLPDMGARADSIPPLAAIPDGVTAQQKAKLTQQKRALENKLKNFQAAAGAFNAKSASEQTDAEYNALQSQRSDYIKSAIGFNRDVDSSIVDARNLPSGLPKTVADQIPNTPAGDRVRKGYQAIQDHDWKAALAWFQDALNHDPGNAGIKRLIELAQYTLASKKQLQNGLPPKLTAPISTAAVDKYLENRNDAQFQAQWSDFTQNYLPQHPALIESIRGAVNAASGLQSSKSAEPAGSERLTKADAQTRATNLRRAAKEFDEQAVGNMAYSFALPGGDANPDGQRMKDLAVLQSEASRALIFHADEIERCRCAPVLQLPKDSDIKFLFPLATDARSYPQRK